MKPYYCMYENIIHTDNHIENYIWQIFSYTKHMYTKGNENPLTVNIYNKWMWKRTKKRYRKNDNFKNKIKIKYIEACKLLVISDI